MRRLLARSSAGPRGSSRRRPEAAPIAARIFDRRATAVRRYRRPRGSTTARGRSHPTSTLTRSTSGLGSGPAERGARGVFAGSGPRAARRRSSSEPEIEGIPQGPGYWALTKLRRRHAREPQPRRCSSRARARTSPTSPRCSASCFGSMINMDAPRHTKLRLIVNRGFTPRMVAKHRGPRPRDRPRDRRRGRPQGRVRLRHRGRGRAAAADHLRHDGHPGVRVPAGSSSRPTTSSAPATRSTATARS